MQPIGDQDGITAGANRLRDLDPKGTLLKKGSDGKWPNMWDELADTPVEDWKAWDKWQRSFQILVDDHDNAGGGGSPIPPPSENTLTKLAQKVIFCAQAPLSAMGAPPGHTIALTADPAYASFVDDGVIDQLYSRFKLIAAWGVQTQIPAQAIRDFQARYGLDYCIFQAETSEEYRTAVECGAEVVVGNANAWTDAQREDATSRVYAGELAFSQETYTNLGGPWPKDSSAGGVPAASFCLGVYDGTNEQPGKGWNPSLQSYKDNTPAGAWPLVSVYHAAGVNPAEWGLLVAG
jgi:hypothetical protein